MKIGGATERHKFANFEVQGSLKKQRFVKHAESPAHRLAESIAKTGIVQDDHAMPSAKQWEKVLKSTLSGTSLSVAGIEGVGGRKKVRQMQWCLAESKRITSRRRLGDAVCVSMSPDKRATRFLIRYRCANKDLDAAEGIIQLCRDVGTPECQGADSLRRATLRALEHICTPTRPPCSNAAIAPLDRKLFDDLVAKIECFAADGASDEQLAGRELASSMNLAGPSVRDLQDTLARSLPNMKVVM